MAEAVQSIMEQQLLQAAKAVEAQVDSELHRLENLDEDDLEALRRRRLESMKKMNEQKKEWMTLGHGKYEELKEEKEFFDCCKKSTRVVCHFYRDSAFRCKIVDKHLSILAPKHIETRFVKINAEKCPFLTQRLKVRVIPTLCLAKDGKTVDFVVGFDDLGGTDEFSTEMMEWRIARAEVINYSGDILNPPGVSEEKKISFIGKKDKSIRGNGDDSSDDDDW